MESVTKLSQSRYASTFQDSLDTGEARFVQQRTPGLYKTRLLVDAKKICYTLPCVIEFRRDAMFYTDEEISVITGFLNGYLVRDHASAKVRESYIRISAGLQSHTLTKDDYVWLENALLFLRPYWWSDREDGKMLMDAFLHTQTLAKEE